jgi:hypothetical protein
MPFSSKISNYFFISTFQLASQDRSEDIFLVSSQFLGNYIFRDRVLI